VVGLYVWVVSWWPKTTPISTTFSGNGAVILVAAGTILPSLAGPANVLRSFDWLGGAAGRVVPGLMANPSSVRAWHRCRRPSPLPKTKTCHSHHPFATPHRSSSIVGVEQCLDGLVERLRGGYGHGRPIDPSIEGGESGFGHVFGLVAATSQLRTGLRPNQ
jgi:hypothetical protein